MERLISKIAVLLIGSFVLADILTHGDISVKLGTLIKDLFLGFTVAASGQTIRQ